MGYDQYKVDVLHYINPHLIWVLVQKEGDEKVLHFEQIGIYGIVPQNVTFGVDCVIKSERCELWMPAASVAMRRCFNEAVQVWFSPTYVDKKFSIFDDNTHIYGDLRVIKKNGVEVNVLQEIVNSEFACDDESSFHQQLCGHNLKTQLNYVTMHEILNKIKEAYKTRDVDQKIWLTAIKNQTSILHEGKLIEASVMSQKMEVLCDRENVEKLLKNKLNVLKLCKDVDDVSVGRACSRNSATSASSSIVSVALRKKLEWLESHSVNSQPKEVTKPAAETDQFTEPANLHADDRANVIPVMKTNEGDQNNNAPSPKEKNHLPEDNRKDTVKQGTQSHQTIDKKGNLIAFGPPGLKPDKFSMKPQKTVEEIVAPVIQEKRKPAPETEYEVKKDDDVYANADSEVNLKISNLDLLKRIKTLSSVQNDSDPNAYRNKSEALSVIRRKIKYLEEKQSQIDDSLSSVSDKNCSNFDLDWDESLTGLEEKLGLQKNIIKKDVSAEIEPATLNGDAKQRNVNPFKNIDGSISVFVDKLVSPVLMVHTKKENRIEPVVQMRDIPFGDDIHIALRNIGVKKPMRPQTVAWPTILRGHSFFLVGPSNSGTSMGYLPAVCRLVHDFKNTPDKFGLSCIIVCATSHSVASVESKCKMFLHSAKIFACYSGMGDMHITTSLLNGCDLLICTPTMLVRLILEDFSLDFRNLSTFVIDDCECVSTVYDKEIKFCLLKVADIVKNRTQKKWKVQHIIVSRLWCDLMTSLARKVPDTVVCISAFEECVLYSKAATSIEFVAEENKLTSVINFLEGIDKSKKSVIVCRTDDEVKLIEKALSKLQYVVFACDSTMTVQDLYNLDKTLKDYEEPVLGPILVCRDGNLTHLNVSDAHYLVHYSLPDLFSVFCKRFAVLIENYQSIFKAEKTDVKIKILFDDTNIEQLPKILHFIKRCTDVPPFLDKISSSILTEKYLKKAQNLVPVCRSLLNLGKCPDFWNCIERHAIFKEFDSPKPWMPKEGVITFQILHYHTAVYYSARIISCIIKSNITKYPKTYSLLSIKMGMYYSKEANRKLLGVPKVGDVCAVTVKQDLYVRCQVAKILTHEKNRSMFLLIKLIDEERYETAHATSLYCLPDDLKNIETHVVIVTLANLMPKDKDITFSRLAVDKLKRITDENDDLYMRGKITMVVGNNIFVETLEACQDLSSLDEVVVKCDFRKELLDSHAVPNPDHIVNLMKVCDYTSDLPEEKDRKVEPDVATPIKVLPKGRWAHIDSEGFSSVFFMYAENPDQFFLRPVKFDKCLTTLIKDIKKYVTENPQPIEHVNVGDIVLAEFPDDATHERARIDSNVKNSMVKCFFVDQGEWRDVSIKKVLPITEQFITQLPFQAIECRLVGIKPFGNNWTDFSTNFFIDSCYDSVDKLKHLFTKYFTKEKAEFTEGYKYGVVLIDTYSAEDVIINEMMVDRNLAEETDEIELLNGLKFERQSDESLDSDTEDEHIQPDSKVEKPLLDDDKNKQEQYIPSGMSNNLIRSVPLVGSDSSFDDFELVADGYNNVCDIPISELVRMGGFTNTKCNEKALTSPTIKTAPPSNACPNQLSKPKVLWRQNKNTVTLKIKLVVDVYDLTIKERYMTFSANVNDTNYGFDFELYGVVDLNKCSHCNKGQYIQIKLWKVMHRNWSTLTRHNELNKWIVYDIESIDISSDEESDIIDHRKVIIDNAADSDSDYNLQDDTY